jgi:hypothetical protein
MIHDPNEPFDFNKKIRLISPSSVSGGNYFIRCFNTNQTALCIQSPKCKSKLGIIAAGKKMYSDLVFTHEDESFLRWIENFEEFCQKKIFENRREWFDSELEMHDIENSFLPSLKTYKSGKQHVLRANIPLRLGKCALKIYDEQEQDVAIDQIVENTNLITILEIQGIKCSSRSFQIEYEIKQMMMLKPVDIFEKCVILKKDYKPDLERTELPVISQIKVDLEENTSREDIILEEESPKEVVLEEKSLREDIVLEEELLKEVELESKEEDFSSKNDLGVFVEPDICEIDLEVPLDDNIVQLKNRNEVYFEMYREAKRKAKLARDFALTAYLEAKRIKNTYLLDEVFDSDDDEPESSLEEMKF